MNIVAKVKRFLADESGPTSVEYAVMVMLIILACFSAIQFFGNSVGNSFGDSQNQLSNSGLGS